MGIWTDDPSGGGGGAREAIRLYEFNGIEVGSIRRPLWYRSWTPACNRSATMRKTTNRPGLLANESQTRFDEYLDQTSMG